MVVGINSFDCLCLVIALWSLFVVSDRKRKRARSSVSREAECWFNVQQNVWTYIVSAYTEDSKVYGRVKQRNHFGKIMWWIWKRLLVRNVAVLDGCYNPNHPMGVVGRCKINLFKGVGREGGEKNHVQCGCWGRDLNPGRDLRRVPCCKPRRLFRQASLSVPIDT